VRARLRRSIFEESPDARQLARGGGSTETVGAALRKKRAKVSRRKVEQLGRRYLLPTIPAKEVDQPMRGGNVGANGMRGAASVVLKMARPARGEFARRVRA
jgi:hypothetical protein